MSLHGEFFKKREEWAFGEEGMEMEVASDVSRNSADSPGYISSEIKRKMGQFAEDSYTVKGVWHWDDRIK